MSAAVAAAPRKPFFRRGELWGLFFAAPAIIGFFGFTIGPMIYSIFVSFTESRLGSIGEWVGLHHYVSIFTTDIHFAQSLRVTFTFAAMSIPLSLGTAFFIALLLNTEGLRGVRIWRVIAYVPSIVPAVASIFLWRWIFNPGHFGIANNILSFLGLPNSAFFWSERAVLPSFAFMGVWGIGGTMIIYLAGLQGVPRALYEAIEIDGGGAFSKFRYATLPYMTPTIFFTLIMGIIGSLQTFMGAFLITEGGPNNASLFFGLHLFRTAFTLNNLGRAAALSWVLFVIIMFFTLANFALARFWVYYEGGEQK